VGAGFKGVTSKGKKGREGKGLRGGQEMGKGRGSGGKR